MALRRVVVRWLRSPTTIAARTPPVFSAMPFRRARLSAAWAAPSWRGSSRSAQDEASRMIFRAEDNAVGVVVQTLGGIRHIAKSGPGCGLRPHIWADWRTPPGSGQFPRPLFPPSAQRSPGPPCKRGPVLSTGGEGHFFSGVGPCIFASRAPVVFMILDAQHCAQKQADRIPLASLPSTRPAGRRQQNCRRRQQKPHLRQK